MDCGYVLEPHRRGGSNEYQESMFLSRNRKINVYPCKPQFYCIKVRFIVVKTIQVYMIYFDRSTLVTLKNQPRKLHCCRARVLIKPRLRFSFVCAFFVCKDNILFYILLSLQLMLNAVWRP